MLPGLRSRGEGEVARRGQVELQTTINGERELTEAQSWCFNQDHIIINTQQMY